MSCCGLVKPLLLMYFPQSSVWETAGLHMYSAGGAYHWNPAHGVSVRCARGPDWQWLELRWVHTAHFFEGYSPFQDAWRHLCICTITDIILKWFIVKNVKYSKIWKICAGCITMCLFQILIYFFRDMFHLSVPSCIQQPIIYFSRSFQSKLRILGYVTLERWACRLRVGGVFRILR